MKYCNYYLNNNYILYISLKKIYYNYYINLGLIIKDKFSYIMMKYHK
jgi:hypothetical protein